MTTAWPHPDFSIWKNWSMQMSRCLWNPRLAEGCLTESQKRAIVWPAIEKPAIDPGCRVYGRHENLMAHLKPYYYLRIIWEISCAAGVAILGIIWSITIQAKRFIWVISLISVTQMTFDMRSCFNSWAWVWRLTRWTTTSIGLTHRMELWASR